MITKKLLKKQARKEQKIKWNLVRQQVKERQNNKCYICEKEIFGKSAHTHHIVDRRVKELFFDLQNLILLCPRCHKLDKLSVHNTAIYFSMILQKKDIERWNYLIDFLEQYQIKEKEK